MSEPEEKERPDDGPEIDTDAGSASVESEPAEPEQTADGSNSESAADESSAGVEATEVAAEPGDDREVLVELDGVVKHYGPIRAVDGLSFQVRRGEILGFLGPNGAGKTTAMRIATGFLEPDAGAVRLAGHDLRTESIQARQKLGYLPENAPAYGEMTVDGFLRFVAQARGLDGIDAAVARVVELAALQKVRHQTIETLSKGFKRRVGLAQALIHDPEVLILDEPTDGLDPNQKAMVQRLISSLSEDKCIILSTHILDEVERTCNRVMIIAQGKILVDGSPDELIAQAPGEGRLDDLFRSLTGGAEA